MIETGATAPGELPDEYKYDISHYAIVDPKLHTSQIVYLAVLLTRIKLKRLCSHGTTLLLTQTPAIYF